MPQRKPESLGISEKNNSNPKAETVSGIISIMFSPLSINIFTKIEGCMGWQFGPEGAPLELVTLLFIC